MAFVELEPHLETKELLDTIACFLGSFLLLQTRFRQACVTSDLPWPRVLNRNGVRRERRSAGCQER
jgi:hypothetical protein